MTHLNLQAVFPLQILVYELYAVVFRMESSWVNDLSSFHDSPCQKSFEFASLAVTQ